MGNIFVVGACTAGKGIGKVASFVGKIFVVKPPTTNILPHENYTLYGIYSWQRTTTLSVSQVHVKCMAANLIGLQTLEVMCCSLT